MHTCTPTDHPSMRRGCKRLYFRQSRVRALLVRARTSANSSNCTTPQKGERREKHVSVAVHAERSPTVLHDLQRWPKAVRKSTRAQKSSARQPLGRAVPPLDRALPPPLTTLTSLCPKWTRLPLLSAPALHLSSHTLAVVDSTAYLFSGELHPRTPVPASLSLISLLSPSPSHL